MKLPQLRRIRWGVRAVLLLGVAASVTANILHARDNIISQTIAAWPPLALLLTVELISRVPVHRRSLAAVRMAATAAIAGIAAWVSYWHMAGVTARYGETGAAPYLMPFSVDGLVVVASVCLVELAGRIRSATAEVPPVVGYVREVEPAAPVTLPAGVDGVPLGRGNGRTAAPVAGGSSAPDRAEGSPVAGADHPAEGSRVGPVAVPVFAASVQPARGGAVRARVTGGTSGRRARQTRRPVAETRALAERIAAEHPALSQAEVAARLGITPRRLRAILADPPAAS